VDTDGRKQKRKTDNDGKSQQINNKDGMAK